MKLTAAQKRGLASRGYVMIPGLVAPAKVNAALREINKTLGRSSSFGKSGMREEADARGPWAELENGPAISDLFDATPVRALVESLLGKGGIDADLQRGVLLRFPQEPSGPERTSFHVDGFEYGGGVDARGARRHGHTLAVEILLSDAPREGLGNFALIPGSHRRLAEHFRAHPEAVEQAGMPDVPLGRPLSVKGRAGDAIVYHYQVAHSAFAFKNLSSGIHYAAFFWVKKAGHDGRWRETLTDLWAEWPGMKGAAARRGAP